MPLWLRHVHDNIWSVRENAATALGLVAQVCGAETLARVVQELDETLLCAQTQSAQSSVHGALQNVTTFGVAAPVSVAGQHFTLEDKRQRDNDATLHRDAAVFRCAA